MKKKMHAFILLAALCVLLAPFSSHADDWGTIIIPPGKAIKIGLGAMLTGDYASLGIDIKHGTEMAVEKKGAILGHRVVLQAEDDGCAGPSSVAIAEKLCNDPLIVGLVGYMCSGGSKPASDIHNKYKVVMVSPSSTALELTARGIPIFFRTCWNDKIQARRAASFAYSRKWTKIAVIHDKSAEHIRLKGGKILAIEGVTRGDKDFSPVLTKIKPLKPQLIYFGGMAAEGVLLARQMKRVGLRKTHFMSDDGCYTEKDFIQAGGQATNGCYVTYAKQPDPDWVKKAASILMLAVEKAAEKQSDGSLVIGKRALRNAVADTKYNGITGEISFDPYGDRTGSVVVIYKVVEEDGKRFFKQMVF